MLTPEYLLTFARPSFLRFSVFSFTLLKAYITYYNKGLLKPVVAAAYDQSSVMPMANMTGVSAGVKTLISLIVVA